MGKQLDSKLYEKLMLKWSEADDAIELNSAKLKYGSCMQFTMCEMSAINESKDALFDEMLEALKFYADPNSWIVRKYGRENACEYYSYSDQINESDTDLDHFETRKKRTIAGKRAREVIARAKELKK